MSSLNDSCPHCGNTEFVTNCYRCGAPQCCDKCCFETTQAFLKALRGGIEAEGNSREELEEISSTLAKEPEFRRDPYSDGNNN